jgi:Right handed beta helix region
VRVGVRPDARAVVVLGVLVPLLAAAGCHLDDRRSVTLQLSASGACVRTSLACGGEIGVVVADAMTNAVLDSRCVSFGADGGTALEKLPAILEALEPPLDGLPTGRGVVVEVAVYSPTSGKSCPRYDATKATNPAVPSYFGRSGTVMVGAVTSIGVSLTCMPSTCLACTRYASPTGVDPSPPPTDGSAPGDAGLEGGQDGGQDGRVDGRAEADAHAESVPRADVDARLDVAPVASTDGAAAGSADEPFRTVARLVASLSAGQTGCVEDGTYVENITFPKGGSTTGPITLSAAPGAHPVLNGVITIPDTTDYIAIQGFVLDGATTPPSKSASPLVRGDHVALRSNDITNLGADCITLGDPSFGTAKTETIEGNRIHGCKTGIVGKLAESSLVADNVIYDNTGDGVAFLPNGDSFTVEHNIIDGNASGVLFGSDGKVVSINDVVRLNVISNSTVGFDVYSAYPAALGTGNSATNNCLWMGAKGEVATPMKGFSVKNNTSADPMYVDRPNKVFRLAPTSPCLGMGPVR